MATSPVPTWAREQSPYHRGPTAGGVLQLAVLVLVAVIVWQFFTTDSGAAPVDRKAGVSLCEEHQGDPGWAAVCRAGAGRWAPLDPGNPPAISFRNPCAGLQPRRAEWAGLIRSACRLYGARAPLSRQRARRDRGALRAAVPPSAGLDLAPLGTAFGGDLD